MKLKVCQIIPTLVQGGAEKQVSLLAAHLGPEQFESHVIVLTHSGPLENDLKKAGVRVHQIGKLAKADPRAMIRLLRTLRSIQPHIVQTWLFAANSYGRCAARWAGVPIVIGSERCVDHWKQFGHLWIDRWLASRSTCLVTNSTGVVDFYEKRHIPRRAFHVIANAFLPTAGCVTRHELFRRLGIPPRRYVVGAVGRLWPQKGYPDLLWASELLRVALSDPQLNPNDVWFLIFGDGPERARLQKLRDQYGCQDVVRFVGHRSDAGELITGLDALWNGSLYEGQSNSILEAMGAGVPVIASDIPGNRDLVLHGQTGYLYSLGNVGQLARLTNLLLRDEDKRRAMGENAKAHVAQNFSIERMVHAYQELYQQLWSHHSSKSRE